MEKPGVLPTGTVTFLFTDIEGSVPLWEKMPAEMQAAVRQHHHILRQVIEANCGHVFQTTGDAVQAAFSLAEEGLAAAIAGQRALQSATWGVPQALRVRMGLHTGPAEIEPEAGPHGDLEYRVNHSLNRAARVMSAGHGGQILLSQEAADLVIRNLNGNASLVDLGEHHLKGLQRPEHLYQVLAPGLQQQFPPLTSGIIHPNNLPVQLTSFIGRKKQIAEIRKALSTNRLVTLTGSGGTGKTRLALEVAARELEKFPEGAWLVELAPVTDPELVLATTLTAFGLREQPGQTALHLLLGYLRPKTLLILLDNCEHLIEVSAQLVRDVLLAAPKVRFLATSREALGVSGELAWRVPSLSLPDPKETPEVDQLCQYESVRLFVERALLVNSHFRIQTENARAITQICCRLDGIPLAIELAAARVRLLSPGQILTKLDDRFRLLAGGSRTALPRQQTLRALIDWSYGLLTDAERILFRRLAVFSGGWTLEAAEQVCADEKLEECEILDLLSRLVDKSMVIAKQGEPETRYRLLETIRQYARERLFDTDEVEQVRSRHLDFFLELAEKAEPEVRGHDQLTWLSRLVEDLDNLRSALEWAQHEDAEVFLRLASALWRFWNMRSLIVEGSTWLLKALELNPELHSAEGVKAVTRASSLLRNMLEIDRAIQFAQKAVSLGEELQDKRTLALAYQTLHSAATFAGQKLLIQTSQERGLALSRETGDHWAAAGILGDYFTDPFDLKKDNEAKEDGVNEARLAGDLMRLGYCLSSAGFSAFMRGDFSKAHDYLLESVSVASRLNDPWVTSARINDLALLALFVDDYAQANDLYAQSLLISKNVGSNPSIVLTLLFSAQVDWATKDFDCFSAKIREAEEIASQQELTGFLVIFLDWSLGLADLFQGKLEAAGERFRATLALSSASTTFVPIDCLQGLALVAAEKNRGERAVQLFAANEKIRTLTGFPNIPFRQRLEERYLERTLKQLGQENFTANWELGKEMSREEAFAYALEDDSE